MLYTSSIMPIEKKQSCIDWVRRYNLFQNKTHPKDLGENEVQDILIYLASARKVSASKQQQTSFP